MQFNTSDFALWTMEEYVRKDGTKPEINEQVMDDLHAFCAIADIFAKKYETGEIETEIEPESENLVISFSSEGIGRGQLVLENVYKK